MQKHINNFMNGITKGQLRTKLHTIHQNSFTIYDVQQQLRGDVGFFAGL